MKSSIKITFDSFHTLQQEWNTILAREAESDSVIFQNMVQEWEDLYVKDCKEVNAWIEQYNAMLSEQLILVEQKRWISGPSDFLTIIGQQRHEVYHSSFLAWLLDPSMPHGLHDKFLRKIVFACFPNDDLSLDLLNGAVAQREVSEVRSRADIVIIASRVHIVCEVKIDARERDGQCQDLFDDHSDNEGARFIFLTPDGRKPSSAPKETVDKYRTISFGQIKKYLASLLEELEKEEENRPVMQRQVHIYKH